MQHTYAEDPGLDEELASLRADFPYFRIWSETIVGSVRYVACRVRSDVHPHTVVASDPREVRAALTAGFDESAGVTRQADLERVSDRAEDT